MYDQMRTNLRYEAPYSVSVPNIYWFMLVVRNFLSQSLKRPTRITLRSEKHRTMVTVDTGDSKSLRCKKYSDF